ncbi:hypothetical protein O3G_MSEX007958 [Manduca sexta]|uniref:A kinase anchor protein 200 n=1 Tax=Manduca sexta TaxID=7130 RepID=A0A921Z807_MANSE|nr:hypothetical protein O3G_MSEX007958 [Manduca sexta]
MGARQSKRSVDISGKEAEGAGEVAAAGAGGEGRVEQLADADALKPQLNGDAHIHEPTDKEKELDSGTPENEKDATTEKENKEQNEDKDKEATPVSNGDGEKPENGETATTPEDGKKPKKEKVKKKWSLRSISFSRKDKPKQEKKQKEEEPKTNGEPEKVPEETAEASPEPVVSEETEDVKATVEAKDEKAPDTPVTEPITNGSSTPESPKIETPAAEEITAIVPDEDKTEVTPESVPELPINGLSLEETKNEIPEIENKIEEIVASKPEETPVETTEVVPVPEIPVNKEVCVEQVPLIEPTPPPLPANPPPSSVASFAATTMAPELTDASLSNTAETTVPAQPSAMDSKISFNDNHSDPQTNLTNVTDVLTLPSKESEEENVNDNLNKIEPNVVLETPTDTLESNVEIKIEEEPKINPVLNEVITMNKTVIPKIEKKLEESPKEPLPIETGKALTEALESKINLEVDKIEMEDKSETNVIKGLETEAEIKAEPRHNALESKEVEQNLTESPPAVENESKDIEPSSLPLDNIVPTVDTKDVITAEVTSSAQAANSAEVASTEELASTAEEVSSEEVVSTAEGASTAEAVNAAEVASTAEEISTTEKWSTDVISPNEIDSIAEAVSTTEIDSTAEVASVTEVASTNEIGNTDEEEKSNEISQLNEEIPVPPKTNLPIQPAAVAETIDVVELSPPVPIVPDEVDTQNIAMDESNDVDTQEAINPTSQIDSDNIESNIVTDDNKSTEITNTENAENNKAYKEDNDTCKDALGNVIDTFECNGNINNIDTAQGIVGAVTDIDPPADDVLISNTEAEKEVVTPDDSIPPSLSETNEPMPAAGSMEESASLSLAPPVPSPPASPEATGDARPHIPQDPLPEKVCDKMAELITEVSPVPELQTEMVRIL